MLPITFGFFDFIAGRRALAAACPRASTASRGAGHRARLSTARRLAPHSVRARRLQRRVEQRRWLAVWRRACALERNGDLHGWDSFTRTELAYAGVDYRHDVPNDQFVRSAPGLRFHARLRLENPRASHSNSACTASSTGPRSADRAGRRADASTRCRPSSASRSARGRATRSGASTRRASASAIGWPENCPAGVSSSACRSEALRPRPSVRSSRNARAAPRARAGTRAALRSAPGTPRAPACSSTRSVWRRMRSTVVISRSPAVNSSSR